MAEQMPPRTRLTRAVAALAAALGLAAASLPAGPAAASALSNDTAIEGAWFSQDFGISELHERGATGAGVTVALFDSPINPDAVDLQGAAIELRTDDLCEGRWDGRDDGATADHATKMAELIVGTGTGTPSEPAVRGLAPDARLLHYAVIENEDQPCQPTLAEAVQDAVDQGAQILSFSIGGWSRPDIHEAFLPALQAGLILDVAVPNETGVADAIANANGVVSIENVDEHGMSDAFEVTDETLDFVAPGIDIRGVMPKGDWNRFETYYGTSPATAWTSGAFAMALSAWPGATPNQILQSAIRHTSNGWGELERTDIEGFGLISPQNLVAVDPRDYPDVNPLLVNETRDGSPVSPTVEEILGPGMAAADLGIATVERERGTSLPTAEPTVRPSNPIAWNWKPEMLPRIIGETMLTAGIGIGIIWLIVLLSRRSKRAQPAVVAGPGWPAAPLGGPAPWPQAGGWPGMHGAPGAPGAWASGPMRAAAAPAIAPAPIGPRPHGQFGQHGPYGQQGQPVQPAGFGQPGAFGPQGQFAPHAPTAWRPAPASGPQGAPAPWHPTRQIGMGAGMPGHPGTRGFPGPAQGPAPVPTVGPVGRAVLGELGRSAGSTALGRRPGEPAEPVRLPTPDAVPTASRALGSRLAPPAARAEERRAEGPSAGQAPASAQGSVDRPRPADRPSDRPSAADPGAAWREAERAATSVQEWPREIGPASPWRRAAAAARTAPVPTVRTGSSTPTVIVRRRDEHSELARLVRETAARTGVVDLDR